MNLTEMVPRESKFKLASVKKEFTLRPINLEDEIWLKREYGDARIQEIFEQIEIEPISRIVYRLITPEDKSFFKKRTIEIVTEDGDSLEEEMGGLKLFRFMIHGWDEKLALINALIENIGLSRPEVKEVNKKKAKKKVTKKKKR